MNLLTNKSVIRHTLVSKVSLQGFLLFKTQRCAEQPIGDGSPKKESSSLRERQTIREGRAPRMLRKACGAPQNCFAWRNMWGKATGPVDEFKVSDL